MTAGKTDAPAGLVQGTLDMLVLRVLALEPMHGYGISVRIAQVSKGVFDVNPGSLFPAFRRLERSGYIRAQWRTTEHNRRAKYYALTPAGNRHLERETNEWRRQTAAIAAILGQA
jgi:transcriptional regulator